MREFGEVRKDFGEDSEAAAPYVGQARTLLGVLKERMARGGLAILSQTTALPDGTVITVASVMGQDTIRIAPASPTTASTKTAPPVEVVTFDEPVNPLDEPVAVIPDVLTSGDTEIYSQQYFSSVLLGAVMDKTTKVTYLAYAYPFVDMGFSRYRTENFSNQSQLVTLDKNLKEVSRQAVAAPDWGGQLTYDYVTDAFFMNVLTYNDPRYTTGLGLSPGVFPNPVGNLPSRSLIEITKDGAQIAMPTPAIVTIANDYSNSYLWGNATFLQGTSQVVIGPSGSWWVSNVTGNYQTLNGGICTSRYWQQWPLSQPSTSGLIAAMFQGSTYEGDAGPAWSSDAVAHPQTFGYAFLWSTVTKEIVWKGLGLGTYSPYDWQGSSSNTLKFGDQFDSWASVTPGGDAILSINGSPFPVTVGGSGAPTPPAGTVDYVMTRSGDAYAMTATGAMRYHNGDWTPLSIGTPRSVLHDLVTDAVAIVLNDASGVWIFNGKSGTTGVPFGPIWQKFARPPNTHPDFFYPQQFINGALLITYALPWDGTRGTMGVDYVYAAQNSSGNTFDGPEFGLYQPRDGGPRGMAGFHWPGQRPPAWRAGLGRSGPDSTYNAANGDLTEGPTDCGRDGSVDPFRWVIGRYNFPQLQVSL